MYPLTHSTDTHAVGVSARAPQLVIDHQVLYESSLDQEHMAIGVYICADQSLVFYKHFDLGYEPSCEINEGLNPYYTHRHELYLSPASTRCFLACLKIDGVSPKSVLLDVWARLGGHAAFDRVQRLCSMRHIVCDLSSVVINRRYGDEKGWRCG